MVQGCRHAQVDAGVLFCEATEAVNRKRLTIIGRAALYFVRLMNPSNSALVMFSWIVSGEPKDLTIKQFAPIVERPSLKRMLTPTATDNLLHASMQQWAGARELMALLANAAKKLPTCRASDADRGGRGDLIQVIRGNKRNSAHGRRLATPTARDWRSGKVSAATLSKNSRPLNEQLCALGITEATALLAIYLWLMAWPRNYADTAYPSAPSKPNSRAGARRSGTRS